MLNLNEDSALITAFEDEARKRTGNAHLVFLDRWISLVPVVRRNIEKCKSNNHEFVRAQFFHLNREFCKKTFGIDYPPFTVFAGDKARKRYRSYSLMLGSYAAKSEPIEPVVMRKIRDDMLFLNRMNAMEENRLIWFVNNGKVSVYTLAYMAERKKEFVGMVENVVLAVSRLDLGETNEKYVAAKQYIREHNLHKERYAEIEIEKRH